MKILHVIPSISAVHGGPSVALETMTRALANVGVEVEVATTDDDGAGHLPVSLDAPEMREGVLYHFFRRQLHFYKFSLPLTRWLRRHVQAYDVLHLHALFSYAAMPAAFFAARERVPYIVRPLGTLHPYGMTQHHPTFKRISYALFEKRILGRAAYVHYTSALEEADARALGVTTRGAVIPLGVATNDFSRGPDRAWLEAHAPQFCDRVVFLVLARLNPKKGIEVALDALASLQDARVGLIVVGDGDAAYVNALQKRAEMLGVKESVVWAGFMQGEEKRAMLRAADSFVLPSLSENFGIAVVEAMAAGLPVIVTPEVGIAREIVRAGAGLMVAGEGARFAQAMRALVEHPARRQEMGARARELVRAKFSIEAMTTDLIALYERAIREAGAR